MTERRHMPHLYEAFILQLRPTECVHTALVRMASFIAICSPLITTPLSAVNDNANDPTQSVYGGAFDVTSLLSPR